MRKKRLYVAFMSLVLALTSAGAMLWYAQGADTRALQGIESTSVFVAASEIPAGTTLESAVANGWLRIEQIPKRLAPSGAGTEVDAANARNVSAGQIHVGELVVLARFVPPSQVSAGLAIPSGKLAMSINLEDPQRVGNFVRVGSKIAVFVTVRSTSPQEPAKTELLLANLLVLGVGDTTGETPQGTQVSSKLLTLAVTQVQAETLISAANTGSLYLALMTDQSGISFGSSSTPTTPTATTGSQG